VIEDLGRRMNFSHTTTSLRCNGVSSERSNRN
jgi:hypothetical protein